MFQLILVALLPVVAAVLLFLLNQKTSFGKLKEDRKQIIYGVIFGGLAIVGTECGIPFNGAQVNCRDAAVLTAGLLFGAPAGILSGVIGAVERWFAVYWGIGSFTRVACCLSTFIAGIFTALLRKYIFEGKRPSYVLSLMSGIIIEVFHMSMVFLTNMDEPIRALEIIKVTTVPMVAANSLSVMCATLAIFLLEGRYQRRKQTDVHISESIQRWLFIAVLIAFIFTSLFVLNLQNNIAENQTDSYLELALREVSADIHDASDKNLLAISHTVVDELEIDGLYSIAVRHDISEINIVDQNGIITDSTYPNYIGFDMASGVQSGEFLCLLSGMDEYVQEYAPITYNPKIWYKYAGVKTEDGFIQVGYNAERFQTDIDEEVKGITKNRHVSEKGYVFIVDRQSEIVSAPSNISTVSLNKSADAIRGRDTNVTYKMDVDGESCFCRYADVEGYFVIAVLSENEAMHMRDMAIYINTFMEVFVFGILFVIIYLLIKKVVVSPIKRINRSLAKITSGNLDEVVDVRTNKEFVTLSDDINSTVDTLKGYIAEAAARIDQELELARNIQMSALPNVFPAFPKRHDFDIFALMDPAKEVGGDFYDFYITQSDTLHFLIADVSGKGIPAAMFMMRAKTELKSLTEADIPLAEVFTNGNEALCEGNDVGMFVTAWQGSVDLQNGILHYVNAGHNPPLVRHGDGKFEYLRSKAGFVLAGMDGVRYKTQEWQLEKGDVIFLYTDGVTEATNASTELFGEERLLEAINRSEFTSMEELCAIMKKEVDAFVGDAPQFDDITMLAFRYIGQENKNGDPAL